MIILKVKTKTAVYLYIINSMHRRKNTMALYGSTQLNTTEDIANSNTFLEMLIVDDVLRGNSTQIKAFCESAEAKILMEKAVLKKPTMMRLSKADDEKRRIKLAAYELAKEANDPEFAKLKKYTALRKQSIAKIMKKYGTKAEKVAKIGQKNYIKVASSNSSTTTTDKK